MTLFPAIVVFAFVFLFFSKEVLGNKEEEVPRRRLKTIGNKEEGVPRRRLKTSDSEPNMSDVLLRYQLMNELQEKSYRD